jgi:hypothetical protein
MTMLITCAHPTDAALVHPALASSDRTTSPMQARISR